MTSRSPWLPFGTGDGARVRLVCLPHAGAGASSYRVWGRTLPADIGVCPVQLPGRENRGRPHFQGRTDSSTER